MWQARGRAGSGGPRRLAEWGVDFYKKSAIGNSGFF
jgi:hypothetical protein